MRLFQLFLSFEMFNCLLSLGPAWLWYKRWGCMTSGGFFFNAVNSISQMLVLWVADTESEGMQRTQDPNSFLLAFFYLLNSDVLLETQKRDKSRHWWKAVRRERTWVHTDSQRELALVRVKSHFLKCSELIGTINIFF